MSKPPRMGAAPISEPRDKIATMASDWHNVLCTLRMMQDRALTDTPLHLVRPSSLRPTADVKALMRSGIIIMIDDILSTAVVENGSGDANG